MKKLPKLILLISMFLVVFGVPLAALADVALIDETVNVDPLSWRYWYGSVEEDLVLTIDIEVQTAGGDIDFYIMDTENYNDWSSGYDATAYVAKYDVVDTRFTWTVPTTQTYYYVLVNIDSLTTTTVDLSITYSSPAGDAADLGFIILLGGAAVIVIAVVVCIAVARRKPSPKPEPPPTYPVTPTPTAAPPTYTPPPPPPEPLPPEPVHAAFCTQCGTLIPEGAKFCPACGAQAS